MSYFLLKSKVGTIDHAVICFTMATLVNLSMTEALSGCHPCCFLASTFPDGFALPRCIPQHGVGDSWSLGTLPRKLWMKLPCFGKLISVDVGLAVPLVLPENRPWCVLFTIVIPALGSGMLKSVRRPSSLSCCCWC